MPLPYVIAYHLVWTASGWWLPNDPRGSMSRTIRNDVLADLGELHFGRKRVQPASRVIRNFYEDAEPVLRHPLLTFDAGAIRCVGEGFARAVEACRYTCYACAVMPDHVHVLVRKHKHSAEEMSANLQRESHLLLREKGASRLRASGLGRPGVEGISGPPRRDSEDDPLRGGEPGREGDAPAGVGIREGVRRLAPAPGARSELALRAADAGVLRCRDWGGRAGWSAKPRAAVPSGFDARSGVGYFPMSSFHNSG